MAIRCKHGLIQEQCSPCQIENKRQLRQKELQRQEPLNTKNPYNVIMIPAPLPLMQKTGTE